MTFNNTRVNDLDGFEALAYQEAGTTNGRTARLMMTGVGMQLEAWVGNEIAGGCSPNDLLRSLTQVSASTLASLYVSHKSFRHTFGGGRQSGIDAVSRKFAEQAADVAFAVFYQVMAKAIELKLAELDQKPGGEA